MPARKKGKEERCFPWARAGFWGRSLWETKILHVFRTAFHYDTIQLFNKLFKIPITWGL